MDNPIYPSFLTIHHPPDLAEARHRVVEWILATWACLSDPNVLGLRRVDEEKNGQAVPTAHIAISLGYPRRRLAQTLGIRQVEDEQATPRVNLAGSPGLNEPHSYIRVPLENVIKRFTDILQSSAEPTEINDHTILAPEGVIQEYSRLVQQSRREDEVRRREDEFRLRSAVLQALALKNAALSREQVETLVHKQTRERWIRIRNVDKGLRTALKLAIKQAGVETASPPADDDSNWALMFPESEARKLLH
jgi:hypothetical protein